MELLLEQVDLAQPAFAARSSVTTCSRMSATSSSACSMNGTPRKMTSVSATGAPDCSEIVATTMKMPSAESIRRSRRATSAGSPMSTPSTKIMPLCTRSPNAGPPLVELQRQPVLAAEHALGLDAHRVGQGGVQGDPLVVAVNRQHVPGPTRLSISFSSSA